MKITEAMRDEAFELAKAAMAKSNLVDFVTIGTGGSMGVSQSEREGLITNHFWLESDVFFGGITVHVTVKVNEDGTMEASDNITFAGQTGHGEGPLGPAQFFWGPLGWKIEATPASIRREGITQISAA